MFGNYTKPLAHSNDGTQRYFLPQDPNTPIQESSMKSWLPHFLGVDAKLERFDTDANGFYYWAWRPLTSSMVEEIKRSSDSLALSITTPPPSYADTIAGFEYSENSESQSTAAPSEAGTDDLPWPVYESTDIYLYDTEGKPYWHITLRRYLAPSEIEEITKGNRISAPSSSGTDTPTTSSSSSALYAYDNGRPYWHLKEKRYLTSEEIEEITGGLGQLSVTGSGTDIGTPVSESSSLRRPDLYAYDDSSRPYYHIKERRYLTPQEVEALAN